MTNDKEQIKNKIKDIIKPIEANIVGLLWKEPNLYYDYSDINNKMFRNNIWKYYFTIGSKIVKRGVNDIDEVAAELYLKDHDKAKQSFESYGGFQTIEALTPYVNPNNMDSFVNDFKKWSAMYEMVENLSIDEKSLDDVKDMNINDLYDYFTAQINNIFINADDGIETHNLEDDLDEIIDEADQGLIVGMPIPSKILSEEIGGVMRGQIILVGGLSGTGKTTFTIQMMLSAVFEEEEPCVIMLNEQDHKKWKQELLTWIINNKFVKQGGTKFNKKRWRQGGFTKEERLLLEKAKDYLKNKMKDNKIILCHFKSYSRKQSERVIRKYSSLGVKNFVLDTFKMSSDRDSGESFWLSMQEDMRKFDDLIKPSNLNVSLWVTLQLQKGSVLKRYLTGDSIGMAKNVIDVASVGILMRRLRNDEYDDGKFAVKVINPISKETMLSGREVILERNKKYIIIFIEKNRNGEAQTYQIVAEQDLGTLSYIELGVCDIPFDS
ncbi:ATPase domain-containing protein [Niallia alba]|uniref:ATPase domain-containing protein n=1 Tax=Niallia alba TaxID=2729105 RepID=UPI002E1A997D|nr:ATPase domain-containing protein [Niallia alba]